MSTNDHDPWKLFLAGLRSAGFNINAQNFKTTTGLNPATWETYDALGFPTTGQRLPSGTILPARVFSWSDQIPKYAPPVYEPGSSFFDMYSAYLRTLKPQAQTDKANVDRAVSRPDDPAHKMADSFTTPEQIYPLYAMSPGLNSFYTNSLSSLAMSNKPVIDFTFRLQADGSGSPLLQRASTHSRAQPCLASAARDDASRGLLQAAKQFGEPKISMPFVSGSRAKTARRTASFNQSHAANPSSQSVANGGVEINFKVQCAQMFTVRPGLWYDSAMLKYASLLDPDSVLAKQDVFGKDGFLNLATYQLLVGFKRKVSISGDLSVVNNCMNSSEDFNIGGFYFAADDAKSMTKTDYIEYEDNSNQMYIMGAVIKILGT
jgi:hypothetical protein